MILDFLTLGLILAAYLIGGFCGALIILIWRAKKPAKQGGEVVLGIRPSTHKARLREGIQTTRGRYTWDEKDKNGEFAADLYLDPDFGYPLGDGRFLYLADLDSYHVVRLEVDDKKKEVKVVPLLQFDGKCKNDEEATAVFDRLGKTVGAINGVWRRLPGTRLLTIRKDQRIHQINSNQNTWWDKLGKPLLVVGTIVSLVISIIVLRMVWK